MMGPTESFRMWLLSPLTEEQAIRGQEQAAELRREGKPRQALRLIERLCRRAAGDAALLFPLLNERGLTEEALGDFAAARRTFRTLRLLYEEDYDLDSTYAIVIDNQGYVERESGNLLEAKRYHEEAVGLLRGLDSPSELSHSLCGLAIVQKDLGLLHQAVLTAEEALSFAPANEEKLIGFIRTTRGLIFELLREWNAARREFIASIAAYRRAADEENTAVALHNLATVERERGRVPTAARLLRRSMRVNLRLNNAAGISNDLRRLALFAGVIGEFEKTRALLLRARHVARKAGLMEAAALAELDLGRVASHVGDNKEALRRCGRALKIAKRLGQPFLLHEVLLARGVAWRRRGRNARATADLEAAVAALQTLRLGTVTEDLSLRFFTETWDAYVNLVELAIERHDVVQAWRWAESARGQELHRQLRRLRTLRPMNERDLDPEYVALREGEAPSFQELRRDLAVWSASTNP